MRFVWPAAIGVVATFAAGCGGTSSESPWPIEPEHRELGPSAETAVQGSALEDKTPESRGEVSPGNVRRPSDDDADAGRPKKKP